MRSPTELTKLDRSLTENSHRGPFFLPDGQRFLFTNRCEQREHNALFLGSLDSGLTQRVIPLCRTKRCLSPPARRISRAHCCISRRRATRPAVRHRTCCSSRRTRPVLEHVGYRAASVLAQFEASLNREP